MIFPKIINSKKEFDLLYRKGKSANGKFFYLRYLEARKSSDKTRFSVIVSTKISKKSVERNRKRRQLREIIRLNRKVIRDGYLVLVIAKEEILGAEYRELEKEFLELIQKSKIFRN